MNPELYSEQEQQQEQQKNQNEIEVCTYRTCIYAENLLVGMGYVLANLLASWLDLNWD